MLSYLHVKNLALISEAEVEFGPGLNILTGETGAGKSILMGSVNLALGQKVSRDMIRNPEEPALVELIFQVENPQCQKLLKERDISLENGAVIISRKITANRSLSRLNGEVCTAAQIRAIASLLLDIHGQHEHQSLLYQDRQLAILDAYGKEELMTAAARVKELYGQWNALGKELESYQMDEETRKRELSFLEFEIQEIREAQLVPGEDEALEKQYRLASESKKLISCLGEVQDYVGNDRGAGDLVGRALQELTRLEHTTEEIDQITSMLADVESLLSDVSRDLLSCMDQMTFSEEEFYEMDQRLNVLNHLKSKYGSSVDAVLEALEQKETELDRLNQYEQLKEELQKKWKEKEQVLKEACETLSLCRKRYAGQLAEAIRQGLLDLNFLDVRFEIHFERLDRYTAGGYDRIEFRISTNPGEPVRPLAKVVSGGELSRIMLAIKTILADKDETETLIFDEIDTGISGRTAQKVSEKMALIGRNHQVLCITHLPQIAAMADGHYEISKHVENGETLTRIQRLNEQDSVKEIARMLGGAEITVHTMENAAEMKELARKQKNTSVKN